MTFSWATACSGRRPPLPRGQSPGRPRPHRHRFQRLSPVRRAGCPLPGKRGLCRVGVRLPRRGGAETPGHHRPDLRQAGGGEPHPQRPAGGPGRGRDGRHGPALPPPPGCGASISFRSPPPCWPRLTPRWAGKPAWISPRERTWWAPFGSPPGCWPISPSWTACLPPFSPTAWPKSSRPAASWIRSCSPPWKPGTPCPPPGERPPSCRAIAIKQGVVERDETETGERKLLNFGHTLGPRAGNLLPLHRPDPRPGRRPGHGGHHRRLRTDGPHRPRHPGSPAACAGGLWPAGKRPAAPADYLPAVAMDKKRTGAAIDLVLLRSIGDAFIHRLPLSELPAFWAADTTKGVPPCPSPSSLPPSSGEP